MMGINMKPRIMLTIHLMTVLGDSPSFILTLAGGQRRIAPKLQGVQLNSALYTIATRRLPQPVPRLQSFGVRHQ